MTKLPPAARLGPSAASTAPSAQPAPAPSPQLGLIIDLVLPHLDAESLVALTQTHPALKSLALQAGGALWRRAAAGALPSALAPPAQPAALRGASNLETQRSQDALAVRDVLARFMQAQGNLAQGHVVHTHRAAAAHPVRNVVWSPDSHLLVSTLYEGGMTLLERRSSAVRTLGQTDVVMGFAMSPNQQHAAYATNVGEVCMLDAALAPLRRARAGTAAINTLAWSDDSAYLGAMVARRVHVLRPQDDAGEADIVWTHPRMVLDASWIPKSHQLATVCADKHLRIFETQSATALHDIAFTTTIKIVSPSPDGTRLAVADNVFGLHIVDVARGVVSSRVRLAAHIEHLCWAGDSSVVLCGCQDGQVMAIDPSASLTRVAAAFSGALTCVAASPAGHLVLATSRQGELKVFDDQKDVLAYTRSDLPPITSAQWSADGCAIGAGCADGTSVMLDFAETEQSQT